ncbi:accessory Sec system translocase SecA2 [Alkalicoccus chagannorensis]|uniref:accessory Sec system translocase SecA2 n=1 Tax=Alkalicoccus chagannorensis TaxID=427072 RepID=UPI0003F85E93|nr:accessory Sec system translocase SecA2 [Alkalicoccus chagannorensis]
MLKFVQKIIGEEQDRRLKKYRKMIDQINDKEPDIEKLTDEELQQKTVDFKQQIEDGTTVDDLTIEAFAVVREASRRVLGLRHFDVQLMGGLTLLESDIAEMATGEGKTLVASLPSYLKALEGRGVHVITVNDYLASRDRELIGQVHEFLGLTVGLNINGISPGEKVRAYKADITYGVGSEFGFDYLRDNMVTKTTDRVRRRPYHYAIIDEIDSVLIDEAKTPLIIAGKRSVRPNLYHVCAKLSGSFKEDVDYIYDRESRSVNFTEAGITKVERAFGIDNLYDLEHQTLYHYVIQALRARVMFHLDVEYIVEEGEIKLVDMYTGRVMEGRTLSDGLHQAIEAKEGLTITEENKAQATITVQNFFRLYPSLAGMTGTAKTEKQEFQQLYGMTAIEIPTNHPRIREDREDKIYYTIHQKLQALSEEVELRHATGQPVLIGTTSIIQSETVAQYLDTKGIPYEILNAKSVDQEVNLISLAGQKGQVTIATNMAGRGTDIMLGEGVHELGGLYVLGTEKHESRRIDNQLRGRSGRQGDPGTTEFFVSIEDDMMKRFAREELEKWQESLTADETGLIHEREAAEFIEKVQRMCEDAHYAQREYTLKLDDVINEQRDVIYKLRNSILESDQPLAFVTEMIQTSVKAQVDKLCPDYMLPEEWDLDTLFIRLNHMLPHEDLQPPADMEDKSDIDALVEESLERYIMFIEQYQEDARLQSDTKQMLLLVLDRRWLQHLDDMSRLKEGIGLRMYQQEDPLRIYLREGFEVFEKTFHNIQYDAAMQTARPMRKRAEAALDEGKSRRRK